MKLILTGATGFVGRNFLLEALKRKTYDTIYLPVRSEAKLREQLKSDGIVELPPSVKVVVGSADSWGLKGIHADHVIHSAGVIFARTKDEYDRTNVEGTLSLFREIQTPAKALILSSQSASGPCVGDQCRTEKDSDSPVTWYGQSKLEMERRMKAEFPTLNYLCLRPPMIFGARDQATLPLFKMVKKPVRFKSGFKSKTYSFISVADLCEAMWLSLHSGMPWENLPSRHLFVACPTPVTDEVLISTAGKVMERSGVLIRVPQALLWAASQVIDTIPTWRATIPSLSVDRAKEIWPYRWVVNPEAFCAAFQWKPAQDFETVLKETCDWYRKNGQLR